MNENDIDYTEFMAENEIPETGEVSGGETESVEELEVQKAVVEELAADKAELVEKYSAAKTELDRVSEELNVKKAEIYSLKASLEQMKNMVSALESSLAAEKAKERDLQERRPNALALIDRDVELPDRFPGETRDHVLEAVCKERETAEKEGRIRAAQVLESVLVENEPNGTLSRRREQIKKLFSENGNIINGRVMEELDRSGISYKTGNGYLMPDEIIKRTF